MGSVGSYSVLADGQHRATQRLRATDGEVAPCNFPLPDSPSKRGAVAGGCPSLLRSSKTVTKLGAPPALPSNLNSRRGTASSLRQGRVAMEKITVGIDVSKDRLDVAVRPSGECFAVPRTGTGLDDLVARLRVLKPTSSCSRPPVASRPWWLRPWRRRVCRSRSPTRRRSPAHQDRSDRCRGDRPLRLDHAETLDVKDSHLVQQRCV